MSSQAAPAANPNAHSEGCYVDLYEHKGFSRGKIHFDGPIDVPRLDDHQLDNGKSAGDEIDSLVVGPNAWLEVYEDEGYSDSVRRYGPGRRVSDLDAEGIGDNIDSFRLYDHRPPDFD